MESCEMYDAKLFAVNPKKEKKKHSILFNNLIVTKRTKRYHSIENGNV